MIDLRIAPPPKLTQKQREAEQRNLAARIRCGFDKKPHKQTWARSAQPSNRAQAENTNSHVLKALEKSQTPLMNLELCTITGFSTQGLVRCFKRLVKTDKVVKLLISPHGTKRRFISYTLPHKPYDQAKYEAWHC